MKQRWMRVGVIVIGVILALCTYRVMQREKLSGIPDAINSYSSNRDLHLSVIANDDEIEEKELLAVRIIDMCRNNEFQTIKMSYDLEYPSSLSVSVYETEKAFEQNEVLFQLEFKTEEKEHSYNIVEDSDKYQLYLDGKLIPYHE